MPNWVNTVIVMSENKKGALLKAINDMAKRKKQTYNTRSLEEFVEEYNALELDKRISLSTFIPIPPTYKIWDTTNHQSKAMQSALDEDDNALVWLSEDEVKALKSKDIKVSCINDSSWNRVQVKLTQKIINEFKKAEDYQHKRYGAVGWYDYNRKYLGTKWDSCFEYAHIEDGQLAFTFSTAWSPADPVFAVMFNLYPDIDITIKVREEFDSFMGEYFRDENGELQYHEREYGVDTDDIFFKPWEFEDEEEVDEDDEEVDTPDNDDNQPSFKVFSVGKSGELAVQEEI